VWFDYDRSLVIQLKRTREPAGVSSVVIHAVGIIHGAPRGVASEGTVSRMRSNHPKSVRGRILKLLYERYQKDPLEMLGPADMLETDGIPREGLMANMHYLNDSGLVELMLGYAPPLFAGVRITSKGIDLVENPYEFNRRFPPLPGEAEEASAELPVLLEQLVEEVDLSPLQGEMRKCLLRDVQYLRDELSRPPHRWRTDVTTAVLDWLAAPFENVDEVLPSLARVKRVISETPR